MSLYGPTNAGKLVVLGELIHHVAMHHNGYGVLVGLEERTYEVNDLLRVLRELGVANKTALVFGQAHEPLTVCQQAVLAGLTFAEHFRGQGREVLFFIDKKLALASDMESWQSRIGITKNGAISLLFFGPSDDETDPENVSLSSRLDGQIMFDRALVERGILPAIDPLTSTSRLLESPVVEDEHRQITRQVQQILRCARDLHAMRETQGTDSLIRRRSSSNRSGTSHLALSDSAVLCSRTLLYHPWGIRPDGGHCEGVQEPSRRPLRRPAREGILHGRQHRPCP